MRAVPIPDAMLETMAERLGGAHRAVLGEPGDPTRTDVRPAEYVVTASQLYPGLPCFTALVELEPDDLEALAAGATHLVLTLDGVEVPWSIVVVPPEPTP